VEVLRAWYLVVARGFGFEALVLFGGVVVSARSRVSDTPSSVARIANPAQVFLFQRFNFYFPQRISTRRSGNFTSPLVMEQRFYSPA
jgi:hypothetical protein